MSLRARRTASAFWRAFFFGGFFIKFPALHLSERAFALHLLLESAERLLDIIVADYDLNQGNTLLLKQKRGRPVLATAANLP